MPATITAVVEPASARVRLDVAGGLVGEPLYVLRRDRNGTSLVRQTSDGATLWSAAVQRVNRFTNPSIEIDTAGWAAARGTIARAGGSGGWTGSNALRYTAGGTAGGNYVHSFPRPAVTPGVTYTASVYVRDLSSGGSYTLDLIYFDTAGAVLATVAGVATSVAVPWTRLATTAAAPAGAATVQVRVLALATQVAGHLWETDGWLLEAAAAAGAYFDGATPTDTAASPTIYHRWTGTAHASTSERYTTSVPAVYDYEARQGLETDYILTDGDGAALASVRVALPPWGTWLKDPGAPHRNLKLMWRGDNAYTRVAARDVIRPRGARYPIVLADRRAAPAGKVSVATFTDADARALTLLLESGQILMVDVDAAFGVPVRYVSVGDVTGVRATSAVHYAGRVWELDVDEVAAPVGLPAGQGFTYLGIPALADSYVALAATFATYDDLAIGRQT